MLYHFIDGRALWVVIFVLSLTGSTAQPLQEKLGREYQVKAVFLFNFTQFVEWPSEAFVEEDSPLVIGILGEDPFGAYLVETVSGEMVNGHPLIVRRYPSVEAIKDCHIIYISIKGRDEVRRVLDTLKSQPVLTVSDGEYFIRSGGMVRLFTEQGKLKIRIHVELATDAGLVISSKLLRLAEIVTPKNN